jgi:hypothetical protein
MVLRAVGSRASEPTFQHAQMTHLVDIERLPSVRQTALTLAADLKAEHALDAMSDAVVMRLDDSGSPNPVDELDETLVNNCAYEIGVHYFTTVNPMVADNPFVCEGSRFARCG